MPTVQTKLFQRTLEHNEVSGGEIVRVINAVEALANAFMSTLVPDHVLDIQSSFSQAAKYGAVAHYQLRITYLVD